MVTYTLPLILGVAYGAWLWRAARARRPASIVLACGISLVAAFALGGFSETYVVLQTAALALLLASLPFVIAPPRRRAAAIVGAGLLGSVLSALTIVLAPGTQLRRSLMPPPPDLASLVEASVRDEYLFLARTVKGHPEVIFLAIIVPCLLIMLWQLERGEPEAEGTGGGGRLAVVLLPVLTPILMLSPIAPYEFAVSSYPDARVLITTMFVLVGALMAWGAILGTLLIRRPLLRSRAAARGVLLAAIGVGFFLLATSLRSASATMGEADAARAYAQSWETRDRDLRQAASDNADQVAAASLRHMGGLAEIGRDPEEWINRCVAGTYGVGSVVAK
jgi:hypothetical protein